MARNLIMGSYTCNLGHDHSTNNEVVECNRIEEERQKREHELDKDNLTNKQRDMELQQQRLLNEETTRQRDHERHLAGLARDKEKMQHDERMAAYEVEKMKLQNKNNTKSQACALL